MPKARPWERRRGEPEAAYGLFLIYRDLGARRSLERVREEDGERTGKPRQIRGVEKLSGAYAWVERARAWDNHQQGLRDREASRWAAIWERRRQKALEENFQNAQAMKAKAVEALKLPLIEKEVVTKADPETGRPVAITIIKPLGFRLRDLSALLADAAGIEAGVFAAVARDPAAMSDEELAAVAGAALPPPEE